MAKRWEWIGLVGAVAGTVFVASWYPDYRLEREIAGARREGVPTEMADVRRLVGTVPEVENAAPLIRAAIAADRAETDAERRSLDGAATSLAKGKSTPTEIAWLRTELVAHPDLLARWQRAAARPHLDYGRSWEDGAAMLFPEYAALKTGARRLVAASQLGIEPGKNLLAAARLSALTGQEPVLIAQLIRVTVGHFVLDEARREGRGREIEEILGPAPDARRTLACEPPFVIDTMRRLDEPGFAGKLWMRPQDGAWDRLRRTGPLRANARFRAIQGWRTIWREMPNDGTDLERAAQVLDRRLPAMQDGIAGYSPTLSALMGNAKDMGASLRAIAKFERERKGIREGR